MLDNVQPVREVLKKTNSFTFYNLDSSLNIISNEIKSELNKSYLGRFKALRPILLRTLVDFHLFVLLS